MDYIIDKFIPNSFVRKERTLLTKALFTNHVNTFLVNCDKENKLQFLAIVHKASGIATNNFVTSCKQYAKMITETDNPAVIATHAGKLLHLCKTSTGLF